ncbi:MOSC domain-containing protein [Alteribacillus iranensis]|uniref:MOSC domain-containing protein YiiM n=1 Tax=Alteribacillus iranensis TaxID=930128 RepID=A0A1I2E6N4_9BACI|nr:MOSC domain-containing protein [Alteribacillus iranensis]SFE88377.1 MOSC domain-containing protein YiiM [Alteribacillus iranensis]
MTPYLKQIFIGKPKTTGKKDAERPMDREWRSGIFKECVTGQVWLGRTNLHGDGQADLKNHGGEEKAVFAYPSEHYVDWQDELQRTDMRPGAMGENFSISNQTEREVAIGDTYHIGEAVIQVCQPRQPCWKPARRFKMKELALHIQNSGRTGWYFRVLEEGFVQSDQPLTLVERPYPQWTIERCNQVMHVEKDNIQAARELASCEYLAGRWRVTLMNRVETGKSKDIRKRVYGPNDS